jgi:ElaB/YqjD/DUF883 family membrane-anchored ribosome-binding protein
MPEQQESKGRTTSSGNGEANASNYGVAQATEAMEKLRTVVDQASKSIKDWTQLGQQWAQNAPGRAQEMAQQMREQSGKAVGTMSETVEQNPLASMAVAFAVGFLLASLIKKR